MKRRSFLKVVGGAAGGYALGVSSAWAREFTVPIAGVHRGMPRRLLGRTGEKISVIGFPGLAMIHGDLEEGNAAVKAAYEAGVNYFDVAPAYGNGKAEVRLGEALQQVDRDRIFLANKTKMRDAKGCELELNRSLDRLKTDRFDLYQLHHLRKPEEVEQALGPGGAMETILKAREAGKVRFIGFSAHTTKAALLALEKFPFDTVMFPINFVELFTIGFGREVLEAAHQKGAGVLAIKTMSAGAWPQGVERTRKWWYRTLETQADITLAIRFSLSQRGVVAGLSPAWLDLFQKSIAAGWKFQPIAATEVELLKQRAQHAQSVFQREEAMVALGGPTGPVYPDSPHEGCVGEMA